MNELRNGRGRIRCVSETGWWRDCGNWATRWVYMWLHWLNDFGTIPVCEACYEDWGEQ